MTPADPYGTQALRSTVLDAWRASPARFREDANAEEALALGGYAGRALIELAANSVDAAAAAGVPARIRVELVRDEPTGGELVGGELRVANTGAPLSAEGVAALASLRASAKRETAHSVGHFGVGFTAVRSVCRAPRLVSGSGAVEFSRERTLAVLAGLDHPGLAREVAARDGDVPFLRLPFPVDGCGPVPDGFATEVRLPLLPGAAAEFDGMSERLEDLFWSLPGLVEIDWGGHIVSRTEDEAGVTAITGADGTTRRFRCHTRTGVIPSELLADSPVEQRHRNAFRVSWIAELDVVGDVGAARPIGAPTPTDDLSTVPALLVGTFPVDDTRRRLAPGPVTDLLLSVAVDAYPDLLEKIPTERRLEMVPAAGFPAGSWDARLREGVVTALRRSAFLPAATGERVRPDQARYLPGADETLTLLAGQAVPGLLAASAAAHPEALRALEVRAISVAQVSGAMAALDREPGFYRTLYQALSGVDPDELGDIPVPLVGGGRAIGARGCMLLDTAALGEQLAQRCARLLPGLRLVHPDAADALLDRLGATHAGPDALLDSDQLAETLGELRDLLDTGEPEPAEVDELARLVLDLIAVGGRPGPGRLDDLVLTESHGEPWPAADLLLPDAPLAPLLRADSGFEPVDPRWVSAYGRDVLVAAGVRDGFRVRRLRPDQVADLPDGEAWWQDAVGDALPPETVTAVEDLDAIADRSWVDALRLLVSDLDALDALTDPDPAPSYTAWWIARFALLDGRPPGDFRLAGATELAGLYDVIPFPIPKAVAVAIGVRASIADAAAADLEGLVARFGDPDRSLCCANVPAVTRVLARELDRHVDVGLPAGVRAVTGEVVDADEAMVLDVPWLAQVLPAGRLVAPGGDADLVARAFDLDHASTAVRTECRYRDSTLDRAGIVAAATALGVEEPHGVRIVADLTVTVDGAEAVPVRWWGDSGVLLCDGSAEGVGRAVAWASGRWSDRAVAVAAVAGDGVAVAESALD